MSWISPEGALHDTRDSHLQNPPRGFAHIVHDEPDYGGFLRGRVASLFEDQLIVVYCREEALAEAGAKLSQFARGLAQLPILVHDALVINQNEAQVRPEWNP